MLPRFFAPDLDPEQPTLVLSIDESHHLQRVLRLRIGHEVVVFDGRGTAFKARVASLARDGVTVALVQAVPDPAPAVSLTVVQGILKADAMDEVVRDCTMVGVEVLQPVISERTTVKASILGKAVERWRRIALASAKQCGRSRLPEIREAIDVSRVLTERRDFSFILLEPAALVADVKTIRHLAQQPRPNKVTLVIGPEGGWTPSERDLAISSGYTPLSLGGLTLRAESVPLVASAALLAIWTE